MPGRHTCPDSRSDICDATASSLNIHVPRGTASQSAPAAATVDTVIYLPYCSTSVARDYLLEMRHVKKSRNERMHFETFLLAPLAIVVAWYG